MNIAVMGLGYVGCVTAACLADKGHQIIGVDVNAKKVDALSAGKSPIIEPGLDELIKQGILDGKINATTDSEMAIENSDLVLICVGTPSKSNGALDLKYVENVCMEIGKVIRRKQSYVNVIVRSTILPGTAQSNLIPILEKESGGKAGEEFGFCINPEFIREGSTVNDFNNPPFTIIGELNEKSGSQASKLYDSIDAPLYRVSLGVAEIIKYASNAFHALKVVFANEIGNLCQAYGIDSHAVMDIFVEDTKLNLSPYYLKPGFAFGGSCLPKDLRAMLYAAHQADVHPPVLESILPSNYAQIEKAINSIQSIGKRRIGVLGISFKPNTDDLRESPAVELIERLIGKGFDLRLFDREVSLSKIHGSNLTYIEKSLPHIASLVRNSLSKVVAESEIVVVTKKLSEADNIDLLGNLRSEQYIIDLVRIDQNYLSQMDCHYKSICW